VRSSSTGLCSSSFPKKIDFSAFLPQNLNFSPNDQQNTKTPKLAKNIRK
jgi:hypothetical protein